MLHHYFFALLIFVSKREGEIQSKFDGWNFFNLTPHSASSCSSCRANCIRRSFLTTQFLAMGQNTLADRI